MIIFENVDTPDQALANALEMLDRDGVHKESRNGPVVAAPETVVTEWSAGRTPPPSINVTRNANPFFHLLEFAWMMTGTADGRFIRDVLPHYMQFSDDGVTLPATYGHRWIEASGVDQLSNVIELLRKDPNSRRAVMTMYAPATDVPNLIVGRDVPCNVALTFTPRVNPGKPRTLDLSVFCRSNDAIFGCLGANVVQFSFLHALVAAATEMPLGRMTQISCDFHIYTKVLGELGLSPAKARKPTTSSHWAAKLPPPLFRPGPHVYTETRLAMTRLVGAMLSDDPCAAVACEPLLAPEVLAQMGTFGPTAVFFALMYYYHRAEKPVPDLRLLEAYTERAAEDWTVAAWLYIMRRAYKGVAEQLDTVLPW